jgi:hypothetical protein
MLSLVLVWFAIQDDPQIPIPDSNPQPQQEEPQDLPKIPIPEGGQELPPLPPMDPLPSAAPKYETKVQVQAEGKIEEVTGNRQGSSLNADPHIQVEERSTSIWRLQGNRTLEIITAARATDDTRVDPDKYNLTTFTTTYKTPVFQGVAGDFGATFSSLTLIGSFRGGYTEAILGSTRVKALLGTNKPQWRMHFEQTDREPPDRFFQGLRFETADSKSTLILGASAVHAADALWTVDDRTGFVAIDSFVVGTDAFWQISEIFVVKAEVAATSFDEDMRDVQNPESGVAARAESELRIDSFRWNIVLEHFSRDFAAAAAAAAQDRDLGKTTFSWDMTRIVYITGGYTRVRQPIDTVTAWIDEIDARIRLHQIPGWEEWVFSGAYRIRMTQTNNHGSEGNVHSGDFSMSRTFMGISGGIDAGWRYTDNFDAGADSETRLIGTTLGFPCNFIYPGSTFGLRYGYEETYTRPSTENSLSHTASATISVRLPWPLTVSGGYNLLVIDRRANNTDTLNHSGRFEIQYNFEGPNRAWLAFSIEVRDNGFEAPGQDYIEQIYSLRGFFEY